MNRTIGLFGAISIGIGGMVGGGIFAVLGEAVSLAHNTTTYAFLIAGIIALFTSYSYAKLSITFQSQGGTITFIEKAFGQNIISSSTNIMLWLSYIVTISLYAVAFSSYGATFFTNKTNYLIHILISISIIIPGIINMISAKFVSKSEIFIVVMKIILLVIIIISSISYVDTTRLVITEFKPISTIVAGMIIFVAYEGFELIANASSEIIKPERNLPIAFYSSVIFVILLYILITIVSIGTVPEIELLKAKDYALAIAAKPALGSIGFTMVAVAALLATFSAINATIYGNARLGYMIAKKKELPKILTIRKRDIPLISIVITVVLSIILANTIDLNEIAIIGSASFLLIFLLVNISAYKLHRKIKANKNIILLSIFTNFLAFITLIFHTFNTNIKAIFIFILFILFSISFEFLYKRLTK